jgi:hypothetical protein
MSDSLHFYGKSSDVVAVSLPNQTGSVIDQWSELRSAMTQAVPDSFTRDEWAYLMSFLDTTHLNQPFRECFGETIPAGAGPVVRLFRPRGRIALWLPNNVSLLGPLTLILVSLTGQPLRIKAGSRSNNLTKDFLEFALFRLPDCALKRYLGDSVICETFDRHHIGNAEMAEKAHVRIVFGSNEAAREIHSLPHPLESVGFSFVDRRSEVWIEEECLSDQFCTTLLKIFAIYGQAGCTSPRRVVLLGGDTSNALALRDRLVELWPTVLPGLPAMNVSSENTMARQWAAALGWDSRIAGSNAGVIAVGEPDLLVIDSGMFLGISPATPEQAERTLPDNIQTLGYASQEPDHIRWLELVARTGIKRLVGLDEMHHFGPLWDGSEFWRQLFEAVEISS